MLSSIERSEAIESQSESTVQSARVNAIRSPRAARTATLRDRKLVPPHLHLAGKLLADRASQAQALAPL
jgi:hypothetical protein